MSVASTALSHVLDHADLAGVIAAAWQHTASEQYHVCHMLGSIILTQLFAKAAMVV